MDFNYGLIASLTGYLRNDTTGVCTACPIGFFYQFGTTTQNATCGLCSAGTSSNSVASLVCTRMATHCFRPFSTITQT